MEKNINKHQCINCTIKHLASACVIAKELLSGYDYPSYRIYLIGNLSEAQSQIISIDPEISLLIRHLRKEIAPEGINLKFTPNENFINDIEGIIKTITRRLENNIYKDLKVCCKTKNSLLTKKFNQEYINDNIDIIIPLRAGGSIFENIELKFALRSIEKNLKNYRNIYVLSNSIPFGFKNIKHIYTSDNANRKQMNIHNAIKAAFKNKEVSDNVIFWADDNIILKQLDARNFPVIVRTGSLMDYSDLPDARIWHQSVRMTGNVLQKINASTYNFESHTPVMFNRKKYLDLEKTFDFYNGVGLCYISLYLNFYKLKSDYKMREIKATFETNKTASKNDLSDKAFVGYNDSGIKAGLFNILKEHFPTPSMYEEI